MILPNSLYQSDCLTLLERIDGGIAKAVYLDPPWFSRASLNPNSSFSVELRDYLEGFSRVLQQCHRILADDGSIVVHAEPSIGKKFALILGQVFIDNHIADYILPGFRHGKGAEYSVLMHYGRTDKFRPNSVRCPPRDSDVERNSDDDPRGPWQAIALTSSVNRPSLQYDWRGFHPPSGHSWRYDLKQLEQLNADNRIHISGNFPRLKAFRSEREGVLAGPIWEDIRPVGQGPECVGFLSQQPIALMERVLIVTSEADDLVIDPYCGSGPMLVASCRMGRRWIGCDAHSDAITIARSRILSEGKKEGIEWKQLSASDLAAVDAKPLFTRRVVTMVEDLNATEVLIREGESEYLERKISAYWNEHTGKRDDGIKEKVIRCVASFLNSLEGGVLLIGVADDGAIVGLSKDYEASCPKRPSQDCYELWLRQVLEVKLGTEINPFLRFLFESVEGRDVCILHVAPSGKPACVDERMPVRRGNRTVDLRLKEAIEYARARWPTK